MRARSSSAKHDDATLDDVREAVSTLEDTEQAARRVLGGAHPSVGEMEGDLRRARVALCARGGDGDARREALEALGDVDALREAVDALGK